MMPNPQRMKPPRRLQVRQRLPRTGGHCGAGRSEGGGAGPVSPRNQSPGRCFAAARLRVVVLTAEIPRSIARRVEKYHLPHNVIGRFPFSRASRFELFRLFCRDVGAYGSEIAPVPLALSGTLVLFHCSPPIQCSCNAL